jgi:hypothetical protein
VSFFEAPPPPPEPPHPPRPEWYGPPENELPASFPLELPLIRTETIAVRLHLGRASSNGFEFVLAIRRKGEGDIRNQPIAHWHDAVGVAELPNDMLRFAVEFADGRKVTVFAFVAAAGTSSPTSS